MTTRVRSSMSKDSKELRIETMFKGMQSSFDFLSLTAWTLDPRLGPEVIKLVSQLSMKF